MSVVDPVFQEHARQLVAEAATAVVSSSNEATLRHNLEMILERHCRELGIPWSSFHLERLLRTTGGKVRYADVVHGGVIIEYEPPRSFTAMGEKTLQHAQQQAVEYTHLIHREEGRALSEYIMVVWDGASISFGQHVNDTVVWSPLTDFQESEALKLLLYLKHNGIPLVHPELLSQMVGPESPVGSQLIPHFFEAIRMAQHREEEGFQKTLLLYTEWRRLFGQVVGVQSESLKRFLKRQAHVHHTPYTDDPAAYLFALNTYIALVAKLVAALALPKVSQDMRSSTVPLREKIRVLESGLLFSQAGISNMLLGDFFSWYEDNPLWEDFSTGIELLLTNLTTVSYDVTRKDPQTTRDLFKGMYQTFVPRALRHALGEYYTPDWLAAHTLDRIGWKPTDPLLDPTCGSGTFLLEALRRRLINNAGNRKSAWELLEGLFGLDLNPLAVLATKASLVVFLAPYFQPNSSIHLPVFLADAINTATIHQGIFEHVLQTEQGAKTFAMPERLVRHPRFYNLMSRIRELMDANYAPETIYTSIAKEFHLAGLSSHEQQIFLRTLHTLHQLHERKWNSIWAILLADRFAAAAIAPVKFIAGNPPWVKWSHLPPEYAELIKRRCLELGVFSQDRWVGGIESDISTVITYEVVDKWLAPGGYLGFLITGAVFFNESSAGFRRFHLQHRCLRMKVLLVEDFDKIAPFEGVSNHPTLLILQRDGQTTYPIPYRIWQASDSGNVTNSQHLSADQFRKQTGFTELYAQPVPGTSAGPWILGTKEDHAVWKKLFGSQLPHYRARKGITTDRNGIFFVRILEISPDRRTCTIQNAPEIGRRSHIPQVTATVEAEHLFPLLRGRGIRSFRASPDPEYHLLLPQRGMHGDPDLPLNAPHTYRYLNRFRKELEERSSYRRFQKTQPFWSVWSTGTYTFSKFKVVWKEMSGSKFVAAYVGPYDDPILGRKVVIPDHKVYFVPLSNPDETAYLTALLNAPLITKAISAYASQLSLGISVIEYLNIPLFDPTNPIHRDMVQITRRIVTENREPTNEEYQKLDELVYTLFGIS